MVEASHRGWFDMRPPRGGIAFYVGLMIFVSAMIIVMSLWGSLDEPVLEWVAVGMFVVSVGLWLKHTWARWFAFTFFCVAAVLSVVIMAMQGLSPRGVFKFLIVLSTLHSLWKWDVWPPETSDFGYDFDYQEDEELAAAEYDQDTDYDRDLDYGEEDYSEDEPGPYAPPERPSFWSNRSVD